eukprot:TRINITY_DN6_c0_g1_i8.p1 TRINITY_DN6_c0_g1~~TRINITY_DN6_c0_g1_i8.p1  ORF type:complete len:782 (-),score=116.70 TRINITY_DN6_c0_g1_i8:541-2886(-)
MVSGPLISGIAALIVGIIAIIIGVVISQSVKVAIEEGVEKQLVIDGPEDESYNPWVTNTLGGAAVATRSFYIYNISNIKEVAAGTQQPKFNEVGPYTYRYFYDKIDVDINKENSTGFYRTYYRYVFQYDSKTGLRDTDELYQLNPNYIVALYGNIGPDVTSPVFARAGGIMVSICAGAMDQLFSAFSMGGAFYNQVTMKAFKATQVGYIPSIIAFGYGGNQEAFLTALEKSDTIDLKPFDCSLVASDSKKAEACGLYTVASMNAVDINVTGIPVAARRKLFDPTLFTSFGHPASIWPASYLLTRPLTGLPPNPYMVQIGLTSPAHVAAVFAFMDRYIQGVQLMLVRGQFKNYAYIYEDSGFTQYGDLTTLEGASIATADPTYKFFPEFAAYAKFVASQSLTLTKERAKTWLNTFKEAGNIVKLFGSYPNAVAKNNATLLNPPLFDSMQEAQVFMGYLGHLYEKNFLLLCANTKTGLCLYRKTTVSNMLFGTIDDPLVSFLTRGASSRAGVFTNHTNHEAARLSSRFGDVVDVGIKDVDNIGKVLKINGANKIVRSDGKTNIWKKEVPITGRGAQFPPNSGSGYSQEIYSSALYRNLKLKKVDDQTVKGIKMRRFELDPANNAATPENLDTYFISKSGVMDYSLTEFVAGVPNIPILATNPRLLDADQTLFSGIECTTSKDLVAGPQDCFVAPDQYNVRANRDQYTTQIYIEPITGLPMKGRSVVQFWLHITEQSNSLFFLSYVFTLSPFVPNPLISASPANVHSFVLYSQSQRDVCSSPCV